MTCSSQGSTLQRELQRKILAVYPICDISWRTSLGLFIVYLSMQICCAVWYSKQQVCSEPDETADASADYPRLRATPYRDHYLVGSGLDFSLGIGVT